MRRYILMTALMSLILTSGAQAFEVDGEGRISGSSLPTVENFPAIDSEKQPKTFLKTPEIDPALQFSVIRTIKEIGPSGSSIRLEDGSSWVVYYYLGWKEVREEWKVGDKVVISFDDNVFMPPIALHNISRNLSVWGYMQFPPKPNTSENLTITSIDNDSMTTSAGTIIYFERNPAEWQEFVVGDQILLLLPQDGITDGSAVHLWHIRLNVLYWNGFYYWHQIPITIK